MDALGILGLLLGLSAILLGQYLEGGHLGSILQPTAALIVLGGTTGATLLSASRADLVRGLRMLSSVFRVARYREPELTSGFVRMAELARKDGIVAVEGEAKRRSDPFLRVALEHVVDGTPAPLLRRILTTELELRSERALAGIRIYETAGGYAPTMGILGAVLGLIQVMQNLQDPETLGVGIAIAFVATVYGVGLANVVLLPIAARLRRRVAEERNCLELIVEGALALHDGSAPGAVRSRLAAYQPRM